MGTGNGEPGTETTSECLSTREKLPEVSPIPDSRFPIPDSRFPIPDSRFPIPDYRIGCFSAKSYSVSRRSL